VRNLEWCLSLCQAPPIVQPTFRCSPLILSKAMPLERQRDHTALQVDRRSRRWTIIGAEMAKSRANIASGFTSTSALCAAMKLCTEVKEKRDNHIRCSKCILISDFSFNFNRFSDSCCLSLFRLRRSDVLRMVTAIAWPEFRISSKRNRYSVTPLLAFCI
jgi:hypothetical protein